METTNAMSVGLTVFFIIENSKKGKTQKNVGKGVNLLYPNSKKSFQSKKKA